MPIYAYCTEHDIPITAHASPGGLGSLKHRLYVRGADDPGDNGWIDLKQRGQTPNEFFAAPERWLSVLESGPDLQLRRLTLNLAHFGRADGWPGFPEVGGWTDAIIEILKNPDYPNIYADIAYFTDSSLPDKVLSLITAESPHYQPLVGERLMFGTDFVMTMLDEKLGGLAAYFDRYANFPLSLLRDNARTFLKLVR